MNETTAHEGRQNVGHVDHRDGKHFIQTTFRKSIDVLSPCCHVALERYDLDLAYCEACRRDYFVRCYENRFTVIAIPLDNSVNR